jgi:outer membrane protein
MPFADPVPRPLLLLALAVSPVTGAGLHAMTLDEAIADALRQNPEAIAADAGRDAARARLQSARGAMLPTASAMASVGAGRLDPRGYFGLEASDVIPRMGTVAIEQPLWTGGRIAAGRAQAEAGLDAAEARGRATRARLSADVAGAYAAAVTAAREVTLRERQLAEMREIERQAGLRFRAGEAASTDVSQAAARRAEAEAGLVGAMATQAAARAQLEALVGSDPGTLQPLPPPPAVPQSREAAVAAALAGNPALQAAGHEAEAAAFARRVAKADRAPTVGAWAEASTIRDQFFPDYSADQAAVGVRARWAFFDPKRRGLIAEADASARAAGAMRDAARAATEAETIAAYAWLEAARSMLAASRAREEAAKAALRSTRLEVRIGLKPQLALLDAEREALDAEVALARAEGGLVVAGWRLKALTAQ